MQMLGKLDNKTKAKVKDWETGRWTVRGGRRCKKKGKNKSFFFLLLFYKSLENIGWLLGFVIIHKFWMKM